MKLRHFFLIGLFWCVVEAKEAQELFLEANQLYEQGQYQEALERYAKIKNKGSAVYYNMGNTLYYLGQYTKALVAYHRAQRDASVAQLVALDHNIQVMHEKLGRAREASVLESMARQVKRVPFLFLQFLLVMSWCLFLYFFWQWYERKQFIMLLSVAVLIIVLLGMVQLKYTARSQVHAVVMTQDALRVGPNEQFHVRGMVQEGNHVHIVSEQKMNNGALWYRVQQAGHCGWLPAERVEVI